MSKLSKLWHGLVAAVTSPEAVKAERSLGALIAGRLLLSVGASAGLAELIVKLIHG